MLESFAGWIIAVECRAMERLRHAGRIACPLVVEIHLAAPSHPASAASEHRRELDGWRQWRNRARVLVPRPGRTSTYVESGTCEAVQTNLVNMSATRVEPVVRRHLSDGCNRCRIRRGSPAVHEAIVPSGRARATSAPCVGEAAAMQRLVTFQACAIETATRVTAVPPLLPTGLGMTSSMPASGMPWRTRRKPTLRRRPCAN